MLTAIYVHIKDLLWFMLRLCGVARSSFTQPAIPFKKKFFGRVIYCFQNFLNYVGRSFRVWGRSFLFLANVRVPARTRSSKTNSYFIARVWVRTKSPSLGISSWSSKLLAFHCQVSFFMVARCYNSLTPIDVWPAKHFNYFLIPNPWIRKRKDTEGKNRKLRKIFLRKKLTHASSQLLPICHTMSFSFSLMLILWNWITQKVKNWKV
jgi:hypothetical protein